MFSALNIALDESIDLKEAKDTEAPIKDIWSENFNPKSVFDSESVDELTDFFNKNANAETKTINFDAIQGWSDIREMIEDGAVTLDALKQAWNEASQGNECVNLDIFLRFNVKLDMLMDDMFMDDVDDSNAKNGQKESDDNVKLESFYRSEFLSLTEGERLLRLDALLEWKEVRELIADGTVKEMQIVKLFESLPKVLMGTSPTEFGITAESFLLFNNALDVIIDNSEPDDRQKNTAAVVPTALISEPSRPLPAMGELKIGKLGSETQRINSQSRENDEDAATGLTESELEMMKILDTADNMLNSGSYGDFDTLIGSSGFLFNHTCAHQYGMICRRCQ